MEEREREREREREKFLFGPFKIKSSPLGPDRFELAYLTQIYL